MTTSAIGSSMGPQLSMRINGGPPPGAQAAMKPVAELLGMSSNDLATKLKGGATIADLAAEKGVSRDDAVSAIAAGLKANAPAGITPSDDQINQMAQRMIDGPPSGMSPGQGGEGQPAFGMMSRLSQAFGQGDSGNDLLSRLMSGEDPGSVASSGGFSQSGLMQILASQLKLDERA